ncbi:MAG: choice-of-anchor tandem repeat NxxGxxAF-containing protein [Planctomycetota bacterium]
MSFAAVATVATAPSASADRVELRKVAMEGDLANEFAGYTIDWSQARAPSLSGTGQALVDFLFAGPEGYDDGYGDYFYTAYKYDPVEGLELLARSPEIVPSVYEDDRTLTLIVGSHIDENGAAWGVGYNLPSNPTPGVPSVSASSIYREGPDGLVEIFRSTDTTPSELGLGTIRRLKHWVSPNGVAALDLELQPEGGTFRDPRNKALYVANDTQGWTPVAYTGWNPYPDQPDVVLDRFWYNDSRINAADEVSFIGLLSGPGVDESNDFALFFSDPSGAVRDVYREGMPVPSAPDLVFSSFDHTTSNAKGQTIFFAYLEEADGRTSAGGAWYLYEGGELSQPFPQGFAPADQPEDVRLQGQSDLMLLANGDVAFRSTLIGPGIDASNDSAIYRGDAEGVFKIAQEGDPVPGAGPGVEYEYFVGTTWNNGGDLVAFSSTLRGEGVEPDVNRAGVYATDRFGRVHKILREGDRVDVDPDPAHEDLRTVRSYDYVEIRDSNTGVNDGTPSSFNALGEMIFLLSFTDGSSGYFISDLLTRIVLQADADLNQAVDLADFDILLERYGGVVYDGALDGDFNADFTVNLLDFDILARDFGQASAAAVPEPASIALLVAMGVGGGLRRRRA